jgi:hypothetical protein
MRKFIIPTTLFIITLIGCSKDTGKENLGHLENQESSQGSIEERAKIAALYCEENNLNTEFCILIDMSVHSGKKRFNVWDFRTDRIIDSYMVTHGCCEGPWAEDASKTSIQFSNIENSHCSSRGKYKIGQRGWSSFGVHVKYILHGLETTNFNAKERNIVFHSWGMVPDEEVFPAGTPEGWGCPAVSNSAFTEIDAYLKNSGPTLMWIY